MAYQEEPTLFRETVPLTANYICIDLLWWTPPSWPRSAPQRTSPMTRGKLFLFEIWGYFTHTYPATFCYHQLWLIFKYIKKAYLLVASTAIKQSVNISYVTYVSVKLLTRGVLVVHKVTTLITEEGESAKRHICATESICWSLFKGRQDILY